MRLFLSGEMTTNAEIATHLGMKPHTIGQWRRREDWDGMQLKLARRTAEKLLEKISTDRVNLNLKHFKFWDVVLSQTADLIKNPSAEQIRHVERLSAVIDRAQKGQRLARGLSLDGQTEEQIRAETQAEINRLIDVFVESVKRNVPDEEARDRIRRDILQALSAQGPQHAGVAEDQVAH
jgi:hypothetical protein